MDQNWNRNDLRPSRYSLDLFPSKHTCWGLYFARARLERWLAIVISGDHQGTRPLWAESSRATSSLHKANSGTMPMPVFQRGCSLVPALFQSMMFTSFQGFLRSWNSNCPSLLTTNWD